MGCIVFIRFTKSEKSLADFDWTLGAFTGATGWVTEKTSNSKRKKKGDKLYITWLWNLLRNDFRRNLDSRFLKKWVLGYQYVLKSLGSNGLYLVAENGLESAWKGFWIVCWTGCCTGGGLVFSGSSK